MKMLIGIVAVLPLLSQAQQTPAPTATPTHFQWSEAKAHELDYSRTVKNSPDLAPAERDTLANAVLAQLRKGDAISNDLTENQLRTLLETRELSWLI